MIALQAHAKVNLSLRIGEKRADGYHGIDTVIARLQLADRIELESCLSGISLECSDTSIPCDEKNLAWQAAELFFKNTGISAGVRLRIEKKIPAEGGLAGGSSDAASVLRGMNELFDKPLGSEKLMGMAAVLGSDVPFFMQEHTARCRGRGELVESLPDLKIQASVLLVFPPFGVPTPWAFSAWDAGGRKGVDEEQKVDGVVLFNDLERPVFKKYIVLAILKEWLIRRHEVQAALMSGSGSTVFAILNPGVDTDGLQRELQAEFGETFSTVCSGFAE
ncbi:MAG: 4-(cytidine 5'-diphospho)-2-C-methyl-D-erythritol kinase [Chthoniobacterales bacterium]